MAKTSATKLDVQTRGEQGSRASRRLRGAGRVPGVLYGGGVEAQSFHADARELRAALASAGAVLDLSIDGAKPTPVVLKEAQRHPVRGDTTHIDLIRVRLDQTIQAVVPLELAGAEGAPGVKEGGVLEQPLRELSIEALPTSIPETIVFEIGELRIGETLTLAAVEAPEGVTLTDDPETVVAMISAPRLKVEAEEEIETETGVVGQDEKGSAETSGGE
jgi:large subunit ribosomal protein L25